MGVARYTTKIGLILHSGWPSEHITVHLCSIVARYSGMSYFTIQNATILDLMMHDSNKMYIFPCMSSWFVVVCGCLLVVCGRLLVVCGGLWWFVVFTCLYLRSISSAVNQPSAIVQGLVAIKSRISKKNFDNPQVRVSFYTYGM